MTAELTATEQALFEWYESPALFARDVLRLNPTPHQQQFFDAIQKPGAKVAAKSGHGCGKSVAIASTAIWFLMTRAAWDPVVACTAPTAHQLKDILWREMRSLIAGMEPEFRALFRIVEDQVTIAGSNGMIVGRTARPENPDALQGFHAKEMLFLIDEASGVDNHVFEVAQGALSTPSSRVALTGNPTKLNGYFYDAFNTARDSWERLTFSCLESPLVTHEYINGMKADYGEDSDIFRVRVLGEFPRHGMANMISPERVQRALDSNVPVDSVHAAPAILGVDPAWEGNDRSVIVRRQGVFCEILEVTKGVNGTELGDKVISWHHKTAADAVAVDVTGVGASCYDHIKHASSILPIAVAFAARPVDETRFVNKRAEIWWKMREWFEMDVCYKAGKYASDVVADMSGPEYGYMDNGKIYLESKKDMRKRGLPSPDIGDATALTFAAPARKRTGPGSIPTIIDNGYSGSNNPFNRIRKG